MSIEYRENSFRLDGKTYHVREAVLSDAQIFAEVGIDYIYADKKVERAYEKDLIALYKAVMSEKEDKTEILKAARELMRYYDAAIEQDTIEAEDLEEDYDGNIILKEDEDDYPGYAPSCAGCGSNSHGHVFGAIHRGDGY